jgi:type IV fimbrial biogenesis protein FimT
MNQMRRRRPRFAAREAARLACRRSRGAAGMTLLELMVVLAVIAILLVIVPPSLSGLIQRNRVASQINGFVGDLQFARAEAIKQGLPVTVCASSDGVNCKGTASWNTGWIVFADPIAKQTHDATETVLRRQTPWTGSDAFTASNGISAITYTRDGFALSLPGSITLTLHTSPVNANASRCVVVSVVGRQQVQSPNGSNCT